MRSDKTFFFALNIYTYKLKSKTVSVLPFLIFPSHLLPSPVHSAGFSSYIFPSFLTVFILFSYNNNNNENNLMTMATWGYWGVHQPGLSGQRPVKKKKTEATIFWQKFFNYWSSEATDFMHVQFKYYLSVNI